MEQGEVGARGIQGWEWEDEGEGGESVVRGERTSFVQDAQGYGSAREGLTALDCNILLVVYQSKCDVSAVECLLKIHIKGYEKWQSKGCVIAR